LADGNPRFGTYVDPQISLDAYEGEQAQAALRDGLVIVEDAVTGEPEWIDNDALTNIESSFNREQCSFDDQYHAYVERHFAQARERSEALQSFDIGALIALPVGDGRAYYVVTELTDSSCTLQWRGFSPDRWQDHVLGWGGQFDRDRIEPHWHSERALNEMFGQRKG
jgi:hypothetical protein